LANAIRADAPPTDRFFGARQVVELPEALLAETPSDSVFCSCGTLMRGDATFGDKPFTEMAFPLDA